MKNSVLTSILVSTALLATASIAHAGGIERGGYNIDLLFSPSPFAAEATSVYVMPDRTLKNVTDTDPSDGTPGGATSVRSTEPFFVPAVGLKASLGEHVDCLLDYSQPWGMHTNPGRDWAGANSDIETKVDSDGYSGTCSYKLQAGKGQLRMIGGVFYQKIDGFQEKLAAAIPSNLGTGVGRLDVEAEGWGWRTGVAYEIPEIAFRASLVYNSEVALDDIHGALNLTQIPSALNPLNPMLGQSTPVFGSATMPDSLEFKLQSGIAPDWLAFGSIKWVNWSQLQSVAFCPESTKGTACTTTSATKATSLDLLYRDGWTVSGGVGHKFDENWSAGVQLVWDRGTSTGKGWQTDTWLLGTSVAYAPRSNVEFRLSGAAGILTAGKSGAVVGSDGLTYGEDVSYEFGNDFVGALSASAKVTF